MYWYDDENDMWQVLGRIIFILILFGLTVLLEKIS
jgi:hypothetical protein